VGALLDEHKRAAGELTRRLAGIDDDGFRLIRDATTKDEDCRSIQTIIAHVLRSGYSYADAIRKVTGLASSSPKPRTYELAEVGAEMGRMLAYMAETLEGKWLLTDDEIVAFRMVSRDGVPYNLEQRLEHAIVHLLRHRRQIDRFLAR
jgi:uncharacterized damage-inducible protein DinB